MSFFIIRWSICLKRLVGHSEKGNIQSYRNYVWNKAEEWNKLLERFDETEEELREQMQKEHEARKEEAQEEDQEKKWELSK